MSIEEFMHHKDAYRVAPTYQITTPWPFRQGPPTTVGEDVFANEEITIRGLLNDLKVEPASIVMRSIWPKGAQAEAQDCLIVDTKDEQPITWVKAAVEIHRLLMKTNLKSQPFKVEIRNTNKMYADVSSALHNDESLLGYIADVKNELKKVINQKLPNAWASLAFHMRSGKFNHGEERPTAIVYVKPGSKFRFASIEQQLVDSTRSTKFPNVHLNIEITPGEVLLADPPHDPSLPRPQKYMLLKSTMPKNGVSIGLTGPDNAVESGSLGGWLKLTHKRTGKEHLGWTTCYHCVEKGDPDGKDDNDVSGIGLHDIHASLVPDIGLVWPSQYDSNYSMKLLQQMAKDNVASQTHLKCIEVLKQLEANGAFGKVRFASGHDVRTPKGARLDWAFVESPGSIQQNAPPEKLTQQQLREIEYEPTPSQRVTSWRAPKVGEWVIRSGRTSLRQGTINRVGRSIKWENRPESEEMEVVGIDDEFGDAGDSGSWVLDQRFNLVGVMFGVDSRGSENCGVITPIQDLIEDIEKRTGCIVTLP